MALASFREAERGWQDALALLDQERKADQEAFADVIVPRLTPSVVETPTELEDLRSASVELNRVATLLTDRIKAATVRAQCARLGRKLTEGLTIPSSPELAASSPPDERRARIDRILSKLNGDADTAVDFASLSRQILEEPHDKRRELLYDELAARVQQINDAVEKRRRNREAAETLLSRLQGLEGSHADEARAAVEKVVTTGSEVTVALKADVERAIETATADANRQYAAQVIAKSLGELGYDVEEGFETAFSTGGVTYVENAKWPDHRLRLRTTAGNEVIDFGLVRTQTSGSASAQEQQLRDRELEEYWCADYDRLRQAAAAAGIDTRTVRRLPPGAVPVPLEAPRRDTSVASRTAPARTVKP